MPETETMLVIGSTTTTSGRRRLTSFCILAKCPSRPVLVGRTAWNCNKRFCIHGARSTPTERMLRTIWLGDSSKAKYRQVSLRAQAALANFAAMLDFPVPAVPDTSTLLLAVEVAIDRLLHADGAR